MLRNLNVKNLHYIQPGDKIWQMCERISEDVGRYNSFVPVVVSKVTPRHIHVGENVFFKDTGTMLSTSNIGNYYILTDEVATLLYNESVKNQILVINEVI